MEDGEFHDLGPLLQGPPASNTLIAQINCIDSVPLMRLFSRYELISALLGAGEGPLGAELSSHLRAWTRLGASWTSSRYINALLNHRDAIASFIWDGAGASGRLVSASARHKSDASATEGFHVAPFYCISWVGGKKAESDAESSYTLI